MSKETNEPLWVKGELRAPYLAMSNHKIISKNPKLEQLYIEKNEQSIQHFQEFLGCKGLNACRLVRGDGIHYPIAWKS